MSNTDDTNSQTHLESLEAAEVESGDHIPINDNSDEGEHATAVTDVSELASMIAEAMPEVQEHAIEQAEAQDQGGDTSTLVDGDGNSFDADLHQVNDDGTPKTGVSGKLLKRRGRKKDSVLGKSKNKKNAKVDQEDLNKIKSRTAGKGFANLLISLGMGIGGDEWRPIKNEKLGIDERHHLEQCFADYFEATGKTDIPPSMALALGVISYAAPRFAMPKTQSRLSAIKTFLIKKYVEIKGKAKEKKLRESLE